MNLRFMLPLASALLGACNGIVGGGTSGSFSATVSGALDASLEGEASADRLSASLGEGFGIGLIASDGRSIHLYSRDRPGVGTHPVVAYIIGQPEQGFKAIFMSQPNGGIFQSTSGEVIITRSSGGALAGRFRFEAVDRPGRPTALVSGSFDTR